jgi:hypothetical protein
MRSCACFLLCNFGTNKRKFIELTMLFFSKNQLFNLKKFLQKKSEVKLILIRIIVGWVTLHEV